MITYNPSDWQQLTSEEQLSIGESYFVYSKLDKRVLGLMEYSGEELTNNDYTLELEEILPEFPDIYWIMEFNYPSAPKAED